MARTISEVRPIGRRLSRGIDPTLTGEELATAVREEAARRTLASSTPIEFPNLGIVLDDAVFSTSLTGEPILSSFTPSWRNSVAAPLREAGYPAKEIENFLDLYAVNTMKRLDALMEPEFQAIKNASVIQFGGCS